MDVSGTGEAGGKEKTPKMGRAMMRSFWVQAEQVCDCHRKMERYLNEEGSMMFLNSKDWLRLLVLFSLYKVRSGVPAIIEFYEGIVRER